MSYARIAARHFGARHREYYVTPDDVVSAIPRIAAVHDQPFGNSSSVPTYYCARLAKDDGVGRCSAGTAAMSFLAATSATPSNKIFSL